MDERPDDDPRLLLAEPGRYKLMMLLCVESRRSGLTCVMAGTELVLFMLPLLCDDAADIGEIRSPSTGDIPELSGILLSKRSQQITVMKSP